MKRILQLASFALIMMLGSLLPNTAIAQPGYDDDNEYYEENDGSRQNNDVSYQTFYDELSPHGRWIEYPEYGYVWAPNEGGDFRPYETRGHWVWTDDYESMWVSDYSWGWAPFHYGRWFHDQHYGWMWQPGYEWSPAWVAWRDGGDYYGWAPLRPGFNIGINISIGSYNPPIDYWCFTPRRYINSPRIYNHYIPRSRNVTIINNTTIININNRRNNVFITGPRRMDAERYAGRINPVRFRESSRPGRTQFRNNEVSIYRPRVQRDNNRQIAPRNFDRYERTEQRRNVFDRSGDNASTRSNGNNLPARNERNDNRVFDRSNNSNNNEVRQQDNRVNDRRLERRNVFDRNSTNNRVEQPASNEARTRRPVDQQRNNNEVRPQQESNNNSRENRGRNVFDRNNRENNQPANNENRMRRPAEREVQPQAAPQQNNRSEQRRNVFERNPVQQQRREVNNDAPQRQSQPQSQPRVFENRNTNNGNNREQRSGNNNDNNQSRRFGRR